MSLSRAQRLANLEYALKLFVRDVGDQYYRNVWFTPEGDEYDQIFPTTWNELEEQGYAKHVVHDRYKLTGYGWLAGLELSGLLESLEFKARLGTIAKAFKDL